MNIKLPKGPVKFGEPSIKYARRCSITFEGMNEGFCIGDGAMYVKFEKDMTKHLRRDNPLNHPLLVLAHKTDEELLNDSFEQEYHYYTEWDEDDRHD